MNERLSAKQLQAIPHIIVASSDKEGCAAAGISRNTFYKWLHEPKFKAELAARRNQVVNEALDVIKGHAGAAVEALVKLLKTDNEGLKRQVANNVIEYVLKVKEIEDIEARLKAIEDTIPK
jgi:hypothetical protein